MHKLITHLKKLFSYVLVCASPLAVGVRLLTSICAVWHSAPCYHLSCEKEKTQVQLRQEEVADHAKLPGSKQGVAGESTVALEALVCWGCPETLSI